MLHVIALAQFAAVYTRSWAANSVNQRVRLKAELERTRQQIALLEEEIRIKDARTNLIQSRHRPRYPSVERMAILELRAARGWSLKRTASKFQLTAATIASWLKRLDEDGPQALVQLCCPVNRFPDFVSYVVRRLKTLCPNMGKVKIAEVLARAGLHLGTTTVGRMLQGPAKTSDKPLAKSCDESATGRIVTAKRPNHVWHIDLTVVPTGAGLWCSWLPFALPQRWPFCYWVGVAIDHFSRRAMGVATFKQQPTSLAVRTFLGRTIAKAKTKPRYLVCDRGSQFDCKAFRKWCRRKGIKPPRYGAIGKHGSVAVVERFILTLKTILGCLLLVPYRRDKFREELSAIVEWYNRHRPHSWLGGQTPDEVYYRKFPANRKPRHEPRAAWPRGSPCAQPWALVRGKPGAELTLEVSFHRGRKHLPIVNLKRAA
jgi:transposase InsO family protein